MSKLSNIILVNEQNGFGISPSGRIGATIEYQGEKVNLKL